ncbi:MAG: heme exporter protein CcmD [Burkholderiales bacterium]
MDAAAAGEPAMNWGGWNEFWAMGGYALYVWGSYGVTIALIVAEIALLRARRRAALRHTGTSNS